MRSTNNSRAIIVPASAGSGKTFRIAHEYIYDVLRNRYDDNDRPYFDQNFYKRILAVTFTNKATEEMKSRILKEIHLLASGGKSDHLGDLIKETGLDEMTLRRRAAIVRSQILHDYSHFTVLTNDTFFQRILRAFVREMGIDMNFSTELDTAPVLAKSVDDLIEKITQNSELRGWLEELTNERIQDGERWDIRGAITALTGELFKESARDIIAGAKDKKALREAIKSFEKGVDSKRDEFKAKGVKALQTIEERGYSHDNFKGKFTKIFDKVATATLDKFSDTVAGHLTDSPQEWFRKGAATADLEALALELQSMLVDIYNCHTDLKTLDNTLRILNRNYRAFALLYDLQESVKDVCSKDNSMLLSETKHLISSFISESEAPFIYEKVGNYFDKFMIDEFQDTSVKEWNNFVPLLRNAMAQSTDPSVLIVGDVKQSIYRWRGGDWRILGGAVERDLKDCEVKPLDSNWRSLPNIVIFNNELFEKVIESENGSLNNRLDEAVAARRISEDCRSELYDTLARAYCKHTQIPCRSHTNKGYISITAPVEGVEAADALVGGEGMPLYIERIKAILERGFLPRDITILVRKNSEGMEIAEELLHYRNTFPAELRFEITTEEALSLAASPAVKLIIAVMRLAMNRTDTSSLVLFNHIHNHDRFDIALNEEENAFLDLLRTMSPEEAFEHIAIRYAEDLEGQTAYVMALHEHIVRFSAGKVADLALFDKWWREKCDNLSVRVEKSERAIEILTIHKAKGLENKVIVMPRCSWALEPLSSGGYISNIVWSKAAPNRHLTDIGKFPVSFNASVGESLFADGFFRETVYAAVDALNMLYVATTRAKEQLHIFLPVSAKRFGRKIDTMLVENFGELMQRVEDTGYREYSVGSFDGPEPASSKGERGRSGGKVIKSHHVSPVSLKLRTSVSRYFADEEVALSPRSMGILLHRAFEGASTREDIFGALDEMQTNGELSSSDAEALRANIERTLDTTIAGEWFDGRGQELHRERNIIRPNSTSKRPDRVMTRGKEAVVVDYKFGEEKSLYNRQIGEYIALLKEMGFTSVKGYLWYVPSGKIVEVVA